MIVMTETARTAPPAHERLCPGEDPRRPARGTCRPRSPERQRLGEARGASTGWRSRFVLSTFGLISPGKGIETAIAALPAIVERHPEVLYLVAGRTHPEVARLEGEQYRLLLERRAVDLGVADHVEFDDRFLSVPELADLLHATDVFLTPYRNPEQIASGALTFALAAGCAAISTPYLLREGHARDRRGNARSVRRRRGDRACGLRLRREPRVARRGTRGGTADRGRSRLAVDRRRDGGRPAGGSCRPAAAGADPDRRARAHVRPDGSPPDARRRRRDHPACGRHDPELGVGVLRRRRRPARGRRARAQRAHARPAMDARAPPLARLPAVRGRARRAPGCGTSWATTDAGWTSRTSATTSAERSGRSARSSRPPGSRRSPGRPRTLLDALVAVAPPRRLVADRRLHRPRPRATRSRPPRPGRESSCSSASSSSSRRPTATLPRARGCGSTIDSGTTTRDSPRRSSSEERRSGDRPTSPSGSSRSHGWVTSAASPTACSGCRGIMVETATSPPRRGGRAAARRDRVRRGRARGTRRTGDAEHGSRARNAFDWFLGRNRLDRPLYDFATGGCSDGLGETD